ncbi:DUF5658 family protein [Chloroflexota bacterium]
MKLKIGITRAETLRDVGGLGFVALNVVDIWLTRLALGLGSTELNPVMLAISGNLEAKVLASIAIVFLLWVIGRDRLLLPLNIGMLLIVMRNSTTVILGSVR